MLFVSILHCGSVSFYLGTISLSQWQMEALTMVCWRACSRYLLPLRATLDLFGNWIYNSHTILGKGILGDVVQLD